MITITDVAKYAGVSVATVSATINGKKYVSPELRRKVTAAIRVLDYAPDAIARGLKKGTTNLIGLILPDITNPFFTDFVRFSSEVRGSKAIPFCCAILMRISKRSALTCD